MSQNKTQPTDVDVDAFIATVDNPTRRRDAETLLELMRRVTGWEPQMWGPSIVGFGRYHYRYDSGREGDFLVTGFSPRKSSLVLYVMPGYDKAGDDLAALGKHKLGSSCLYVNKLADVDLGVLERIVADGVEKMRRSYDVSPR